MPDQPPRFELHDDLYALVTYLHAGSNRDLWNNLQADHLTVSQASLLGHLRDGERPTITQASGLMGLTDSAAVTVIDALAHRGYVRREPDEHDKRVRRVALTARGDDAIARLHAARPDLIARFVDELSDVEQAALRASLRRVVMTRPEIARFHLAPLPA